MLPRRRIRCLCYWLRYAPLLPLHWLIRALFRLCVRESVDGIGLASNNGRDDAAFIEATKDALALIQRSDPRRYVIVIRELRSIVNFKPIATPAAYYRGLYSCWVDFPYFQLNKETEGYEWYLGFYAMALVHEATHGRLYALYFRYTKTDRKQIERICHAEESRFARRIARDKYDYSTMIRPFDEADWQELWNLSKIQVIKDWLRGKRHSL